MSNLFFAFGSGFGLLAVVTPVAPVFDAFGAHALRNTLAPEMLETFEVAVRYQMYHSLALIAAAWAATQQWHTPLTTASGRKVVENDNVVFGLRRKTTSWLIFLIVRHANNRKAFIAGWACLMIAALQKM